MYICRTCKLHNFCHAHIEWKKKAEMKEKKIS